MVGIGGLALLMVVGLLLMAVVASFVSALRKYLDPERPESYYSYVAGVLLILGAGLWFLSPPPTTAVGLYVTFGSSFSFALAVLYTALAVYLARGGDTSDGESDARQQSGGTERDRPLSRR